MKLSDFAEQLKKIMELHISLMEQNNILLAQNLDLMKEVDELKKKNG